MDHYEEDGKKVTSSCYIIMIIRNCFIEGFRKLTMEVIKAFQTHNNMYEAENLMFNFQPCSSLSLYNM